MKKIILCLLFINFQILNAQSVSWFEGSIVLSSCDVLVGKISIEENFDLVLFEQGESRAVFPAHKIKSLYFYDKDSNINRRYICLKEDNGIRADYHLYEIVTSGEVDVLRRKKGTAFSKHLNALDFNYFVRYDGEMTALQKFKRKVLPKLCSQPKPDSRLEDFISANKLRADVATNAIRIIEYYNSIAKAEEPFARN